MMPYLIFDAHSDFAFYVYSEHKKGKKNVLINQLYPLLKQANVKIISLPIGGDFIVCDVDAHDALNVYGIIDIIHKEISENLTDFSLILSSNDFNEILENNKRGFLLSMEGARSIDRDLSHLRNFYRLGLRSLAITHNERNIFADGLSVKNPGGLSPFGIELIEELNKMNIILDLVHISEKCFFEVLDLYKKAPINSHSNVKGIHDNFRNLTDEQILAISQRGGVIGMNLVSKFLAPEERKATVEDFVDHVDYAVNLAGIDHIGFGPDFTYYMPYFCDLEFASEIRDYSKISLIFTELEKRGYSDRDIRKIAGENFIRVYKEVLG